MVDILYPYVPGYPCTPFMLTPFSPLGPGYPGCPVNIY